MKEQNKTEGFDDRDVDIDATIPFVVVEEKLV